MSFLGLMRVSSIISGCPLDSFSCQDWSRRHQQENCVPLAQRCDNIPQCPNGRDELECTMLTQRVPDHPDFSSTGYLSGYLHRNYQGKWYPVCTSIMTEVWAAEACATETGAVIRERPKIDMKMLPPGINYGPYLIMMSQELNIVPSCGSQALFVQCPSIPCGTRVLTPYNFRPYGMYEDSMVASQMNNSSSSNNKSGPKFIQVLRGGMQNLESEHLNRITKRMDSGVSGLKTTAKFIRDLNNTVNVLMQNYYQDRYNFDGEKPHINGNNVPPNGVPSDFRIVGGRASQPQSWPFLVAIYRDGYFHCGAVILDTDWIMTAAHCVEGHKTHYYEVQAGLLRRYSYSPMSQSRRAHIIVSHPNYDGATMHNDISLIKLNESLYFNRWIRPTCLPLGFWDSEPTPQTTCVTVGWGAMTENGPDPDALREVEVPILSECKLDIDQFDGAICAGLSQGGKDACQGDSGGPLMCKVPRSPAQWYTAGIVSHGEGCGRQNEPGAYTRVSKYKDWIDQVRQSFHPVSEVQKAQCPGFVCNGGHGKCIPPNRRCNGIVDCFGAEDEIDCPAMSQYFHNRNFPNSQYNVPQNFVKNHNTETMDANSSPVASVIQSPSEYTSVTPQNSSRPIAPTAGSVSPVDDSIQKPQTTPSSFPILEFTSTPSPNTTANMFRCSEMPQTISIHKRCDRIIDCEDGTDEESCTCRDIIANSFPSALCDGHVDCYDQTDEAHCRFCQQDEFTCSRSGKCIPKSQVCDTIVQCPLKEDESDCFALTDNRHIVYDLDNHTHLNQEGVISRVSNGVWKPICSTYDPKASAQIANNVCLYLGLKGHENVKNVTVQAEPLTVIQFSRAFPDQYLSGYKPMVNNSKTCQGLHVKCQTVLMSTVESHRLEHVGNDPVNTTYLFPWETAIFVDDRYHCPGVLLDREWVLTSYKCTEDVKLYDNYTTAVVGLSPTFQYVDGPHQQRVTVDAIRPVNSNALEASLVHLKHPINMTRSVKPVFYDKLVFPSADDDECVALGTDNKFNSKKTFLTPVSEGCPNCHRCFVNATVETCGKNESQSWHGVVVCRGKGGWYPAAVFQHKDILCGFREPQTLTSIDYFNAHITEAMDKPVESIAEPGCDGLRCDAGNCVPWTNICDGIQDCRGGDDEAEKRCNSRKEKCQTSGGIGCPCTKSTLKCRSGECLGKEKFCDGVKNCRDGSDEPNKCNCGEYLRLTNPKLLCDNIRHCLDKTDETNDDCLCKDSSFQCRNLTRMNGPCIPHDFVCDGLEDCDNGKDEAECRMIKGHQDDPIGVGQVLQRSFGVWHSECFPAPITSTEDAMKICRSMGYVDGVVLSPPDTTKYGDALVPIHDEFFTVMVNPRIPVHMRPDRPLVSLEVAKNFCHRAFVKCISAIPR